MQMRIFAVDEGFNLLAGLFHANSGFVGDERNDAGIEFRRRKSRRGNADSAQLKRVRTNRFLLVFEKDQSVYLYVK